MPLTSRRKIGDRTLAHRILLPFVLILILLGASATIGAGLMIIESLSKDVDANLEGIKEIVFREIKEQELLLDSYADLLSYSLGSEERVADRDFRASLDTHLKLALAEAGISMRYFPVSGWQEQAGQQLTPLFDQALRSGKPRFRFLAEPGAPPTLTVATVVRQDDRPKGLLLLQTPVSRAFLHQLTGPFSVTTAILSREGKLLSASDEGTAAPLLQPDELARVLSGNRVYKTVKDPLPRRQLFYAVPLGSTDLVILSLTTSVTQLGTVVESMATRSILTILAAILLGGVIFFRQVRQVTAPIRELVTATEAISRGNLDYRIDPVPEGELGVLARSFNDMLRQVSDLYREKIEREKSLTMAEEELKYKDILEKKNAEIEASNRELKIHVRELSTLFQLNQAMISTLDLNLLFDRILKALRDVIHCNAMVLLLYNTGAEELEVRKVLGLEPEALDGVSFRLDEGITGYAASHHETVYVRDLASDDRSLRYKGRLPRRGSMVAVPLVVKNRLAGVLNLHKENPADFSDAELKLVQAIANQAAIAIENAQLYEKARDLSNTDELTGLANRRHFQEILKRELAQARRFNSNFSVIMADIDHFKSFNDTHGHLRGDVVLKKVASIILQNTRGIDLVGRFGGEEFVILLPKTTREGARAAAEKLRQWMEQETFSGADQSQPGGRITLSLGVAEFPTDSKDVYELLDMADRALYRGKQEGRNRVVTWPECAPPRLQPPPSAPL